MSISVLSMQASQFNIVSPGLSEADTAAKLRFFRVSERLGYVTCRLHHNAIRLNTLTSPLVAFSERCPNLLGIS